MSCVEFEITVDRLVDLTRPEIRGRLRVELADLIRARVSTDAYAVPQGIARRVYRDGLPGLMAPSVHDPNGEKADWFNLVLYPGNLVRAAIREVRAQDIDAL
jgi:RES domain-containing protein